MDPFEVRMQFLSLLRRLNASQQSIQKVVAYSLKYFSRCGDLIWDCIVEECQKGSLNTRINILYLLDSLCEASLISKASFGPSSSSGSSGSDGNLYVDFVSRDLSTIVDYVVPASREGLINLMSAVQILENWRNKRVLDTQKVEDILTKLESQKASMHAAAASSLSTVHPSQGPSEAGVGVTGEADAAVGGGSLPFSRNEVFQRIEEDRERHKRLRERRWVQPVVYQKSVPLLASFAPLPPDHEPPVADAHVNADPTPDAKDNPDPNPNPHSDVAGTDVLELPLDIEFDNEWETTSDWNEDDEEAVVEENALCYQNAATRSGFGDNSSLSVPPFSSSSSVQPLSAGSSVPPISSSSYSTSSHSGPASQSSGSRTAQTGTRPGMPSAQPVAPAPAKRPVKFDRSRIFAERREM